MKALTNSELAKILNVKVGETKTFYFENTVTWVGPYGSVYNFKGIRITERDTEKTSAAYEYEYEYKGEMLTRWLEWNQANAATKKEAQKQLGL